MCGDSFGFWAIIVESMLPISYPASRICLICGTPTHGGSAAAAGASGVPAAAAAKQRGGVRGQGARTASRRKRSLLAPFHVGSLSGKSWPVGASTGEPRLLSRGIENEKKNALLKEHEACTAGALLRGGPEWVRGVRRAGISQEEPLPFRSVSGRTYVWETEGPEDRVHHTVDEHVA